MATTFYKTDDGYRLSLVDSKWTDGDLSFDVGADGAPAGENGEQVGGTFTDADGVPEEGSPTMVCSSKECGNDGEYQSHRKVCPFCGEPMVSMDSLIAADDNGEVA